MKLNDLEELATLYPNIFGDMDRGEIESSLSQMIDLSKECYIYDNYLADKQIYEAGINLASCVISLPFKYGKWVERINLKCIIGVSNYSEQTLRFKDKEIVSIKGWY